MLTKLRYPLLAGTMLSMLALPQGGVAWQALSGRSDGVIILAQDRPDDKKKDQQKGKPAPPPPQPQRQPPPPPPQPQAPRVQQPPPPQAPRVVQPPAQNVPPQIQQRQIGKQPPGPPPGPPPSDRAVTPNTAPPAKQFSKQPPASDRAVTPNTAPPAKQFSKQPPGPPPGPPPSDRAVTPNTAPPAKQFSKQPPAGVNPQVTTPSPDRAVAPRQFGTPGTPPPAPMPQGIQPRQATAATGADRGTVDQLRVQRRERVEGGRTVIEEPGRRFIVRDSGRTFIRSDDTVRFSRWGAPRVESRGAERYTIVRRPGGYEIITVTDGSGRFLRRIRRDPDRREYVLIDNRPRIAGAMIVGAGVGLVAAGVILALAPPVVTIPREAYIVEAASAPPMMFYEALDAPPIEPLERAYSLDEIRYNVALRDRMRRIDIDTITFASGSWEVTPDQAPALEAIARAILDLIAQRPNAVVMIEGHTDAVGTDVDNLSLSDRRAESVANILTETYGVPPENLVTQGYGEQFLKVPTDGPSRENRRVTVRNIGPLLAGPSG